MENLSQSLVQLQKQCVRTERANKKDKPSKGKWRVLDGNDTTSEVLNRAEMPAASQSNDNQASSDEERSQFRTQVQRHFDSTIDDNASKKTVSERRTEPTSQFDGSTAKPLTTENLNLPGWDSEDDQNCLWELVSASKSRQKRSVLYISGLSAGTTESKLVEFIEGRANTAGQDKTKV